MDQTAVVRRYRVALSVAVAAPLVASVLFVLHLHWWIVTAERRGIRTTDWGLDIVVAVALWGVSGIGAVSAIPGWVRPARSGARRMSGLLVALVDVAGTLLLLPPAPRDVRNVLPCAVAGVVMLGAAAWLVVASLRRTTGGDARPSASAYPSGAGPWGAGR